MIVSTASFKTSWCATVLLGSMLAMGAGRAGAFQLAPRGLPLPARAARPAAGSLRVPAALRMQDPSSSGVQAAARAGLRDVTARPALAAGDAAALFLFAGIGRMNHGSDDGSVLQTALPFLAAWFALAPILGAYKSTDKDESMSQAVMRALPAWAVCVPIGCFCRGLLQDSMPAAPFWIIALLSIGIFVGGWRAAHFQAAAVSQTVNQFTEAILEDDDD